MSYDKWYSSLTEEEKVDLQEKFIRTLPPEEVLDFLLEQYFQSPTVNPITFFFSWLETRTTHDWQVQWIEFLNEEYGEAKPFEKEER